MALIEMSVVEQRYRAVLAVERGEPKIVVATHVKHQVGPDSSRDSPVNSHPLWDLSQSPARLLDFSCSPSRDSVPRESLLDNLIVRSPIVRHA